MVLEPGTRIGTYEIISSIGAGGMGEVYRARDLKLQRDVAIKVLPGNAASNSDAIVRLQREARAASALNHPHILTIYDIGRMETEPGRDFIAMEFIDGSTLRDWLAGERELPRVVEALIQIADGLAKAHEANVVHRDLKPDNIMITVDGYAKILDFGLAKLLGAQNDPLMEHAVTVARTTTPGMILGTIGYIAPEQIRGEDSGPRADIFSFGCVMYEAVTSRRAFAGATPIETLQQILSSDPAPMRDFNPATPAELQRIVSRCLVRDPAQRYPAMKEVIADLRRVRDQFRNRSVRQIPRVVQLTFDKAVEQFPALSPDGTRVVFSRDTGKVRNLFMATIGDGGEERLTDSDFDDIQPAWSPSGDAILFLRAADPARRIEPSDVFGRYLGGHIYALDLKTKKTTLLMSDAANPSWSADGKFIAFDSPRGGAHRIWIADARGRNGQQLTTDTTDAAHHVRPRWSPEGRHVVFQNLEGTKSDIRVVSVDSKAMRWVTNDYITDLHPVWSADGEWIVFSSYRSGGINVWRIPVDAQGTPIGALEQVTAGPGHDVDVDTSKGGRIVFATLKQNADLWRLPVDPNSGAVTGAPQPVVTTTRENSRGAWSPDGKTIAFNSDRGGEMNLWLFENGKTRQLTRGAGGDFQPNWTRDGKSLVFFSARALALDIWRVDVAGGEPQRLTHGEGININPFASPDGRRIAFVSDRDGSQEVWLIDADGSNPARVTTVGVIGHFLRWSADGKRIFFRCPTGPKARTMAVPVDGGEPEPVGEVMGGAHMSLSPDESMIMDVVAHRTLWVSPLNGDPPRKVFEFDDAESRIDYPVWSPDGQWVLFDRLIPQGGDVWMVEE